METEPTRLVSLINAAIVATIGILIATGTVSAEIGGSIGVAAAAWVLVVGEFFLRNKVTPVETPQLTISQAQKLEITPD